jgi:hypothetical protein
LPYFFQEGGQDKVKTNDTAFKDPEELQKKVDAYFQHCEDSKKTYELKNGDIKIRQEYPSMVNLARWLGVHKDTLSSYILGEEKVSLDEETNKRISATLICARDRIKGNYIQSAMSGDADPKIAALLLTAMGETQPEEKTTVNVIIQGDSDAYSV